MTQMNIAEKNRELRKVELGLYQRTAKKFKTSYGYVYQIANGDRMATRGKGKKIHEYMKSELLKKGL